MKVEYQGIINFFKNKYGNEDISKIIMYYENLSFDGIDLETEKVTSLFNIMSILNTKYNGEMLDDLFAIEYQRYCDKYGINVINKVIDGGKVR